MLLLQPLNDFEGNKTTLIFYIIPNMSDETNQHEPNLLQGRTCLDM